MASFPTIADEEFGYGFSSNSNAVRKTTPNDISVSGGKHSSVSMQSLARNVVIENTHYDATAGMLFNTEVSSEGLYSLGASDDLFAQYSEVEAVSHTQPTTVSLLLNADNDKAVEDSECSTDFFVGGGMVHTLSLSKRTKKYRSKRKHTSF